MGGLIAENGPFQAILEWTRFNENDIVRWRQVNNNSVLIHA